MSDMYRLMRMSSAPTTKQLLIQPEQNYDILSTIFSGINNEFLQNAPDYAGLPLYRNMKNAKRLGHEVYHLKTAKQPYSERSFEFLHYDALDEGEVDMYRSGMYDIEDETYPSLLDNRKIRADKMRANVKIEDFIHLYEGSVYPTQEMLRSLIDINYGETLLSFAYIKDIVTTFTLRQSDLLKMYPGNHYNFTCRSFNDVVNNAQKANVRRQSINITKLRPRPMFNALLPAFYEKEKKLREKEEQHISLATFYMRILIFLKKPTDILQRTIQDNIRTLCQKIRDGENIRTGLQEKNILELIDNLQILASKGILDKVDEETITQALTRYGGRRRTRKNKNH